jgi:hypothetical protein
VRVERNRGGERRSRKMTSRLARSLRHVRRWRDGSRPVRKIIDLIECLKREREGGRKREREKGWEGGNERERERRGEREQEREERREIERE